MTRRGFILSELIILLLDEVKLTIPTQLFMREFYILHGAKPNTTKADGLREAQLDDGDWLRANNLPSRLCIFSKVFDHPGVAIGGPARHRQMPPIGRLYSFGAHEIEFLMP